MGDRKTILYIAASLDGYIAGKEDDMGFLSVVQQDGEDYGYNDFIKSVDTVILGRRTFDWVMRQVPEFPHAGMNTFVVTRKARPQKDRISYYTGNLKDLVKRLKAEKGKNIFIDGGAEIIRELLKDNLIDEFVISIIPILVGDGIRLFKDGRPVQKVKLISTKQFATGLVQLYYKSV